MPIIRDSSSTDSEINKAAEVLHETVKDAASSAGQAADATRRTVNDTLNRAAEGVQAATDQFTGAAGSARQQTEAAARHSAQGVETITEAGAVLARGLQEISGEWLSVVQEQTQKSLEGLNALVGCRSPEDFISVHSRLLRDNLERAAASNRRLTELSVKVVTEATGVATKRMNNAGRNAA